MNLHDYEQHPDTWIEPRKDGGANVYVWDIDPDGHRCARLVAVQCEESPRQARAWCVPGCLRGELREVVRTLNEIDPHTAADHARWLLVGAMLAAAVTLTYIDVWPAYTGACVALAAVAFAFLPVERAA